jgi:glycosyltransferase involved in cell wall biosynthesis
MIVKNEAHVLGRCLMSVRPYISRFCIVDTGSTDDTQRVIRMTLEDIPGEIHEREFRDFSTNRNEALALAGKSGYALVMDADDVLEVHPPVARLTAPGYAVRVDDDPLTYYRTILFKLDAGYEYRGVVHESLFGPVPSKLESVVYKRIGGGARSLAGLQKKAARDAALLEAVTDPTPRDVFYLALSYRDAGELEKAREAYARRVFLDGFEEERFIAALEFAKLEARLGSDRDLVVAAYMRAHAMRPTRAEPLRYLARYLESLADGIKKPDDTLFIEEAAYTRADDPA